MYSKAPDTGCVRIRTPYEVELSMILIKLESFTKHKDML
jgi:hypothetical protein